MVYKMAIFCYVKIYVTQTSMILLVGGLLWDLLSDWQCSMDTHNIKKGKNQ
jgi:hypothetical protein